MTCVGREQKIKYDSKYANKSEKGIGWKFGFTGSAENWNGRFAMLGFAGILGPTSPDPPCSCACLCLPSLHSSPSLQ